MVRSDCGVHSQTAGTDLQASTGRIDAQSAKERISDIQVLIHDLNAPAETTTRSKR
jgi:hypothetical protein